MCCMFVLAQTDLAGVQPFYMCVEESGKAHGVLFLNSNAMGRHRQRAPLDCN